MAPTASPVSAPARAGVEFSASGYVTQSWSNEPDLAHFDTINVPNGGTATAVATLTPTT